MENIHALIEQCGLGKIEGQVWLENDRLTYRYALNMVIYNFKDIEEI